jgi:uncharacterized small protein (DUF1192 family)
MAREINWDEEIGDEDRAWLEQRLDSPAGNNMSYRQRLAENDARFGHGEKMASQNRVERIAELRGVIANAQNEIERLEIEQAREDNPNVAVTGNPAQGLVVDNTGVDGQPPEGATGEAETYSDEKHWTKAKLAEEIDKRNLEREADNLPPISKTGTRAELVDRLKADDEELAQAS